MNALNILVAEDDPQDAFFLRRAFVRADVRVPLAFVGDGQETVDYLTGVGPFSDRGRHPMPTLLLLDLKMPRMDGFEVLGWLQKRQGLKRLVVLVFSTSGEQRDVDRAYDLGANCFIMKPTNLKELQTVVLEVQSFWQGRNLFPDCAGW